LAKIICNDSKACDIWGCHSGDCAGYCFPAISKRRTTHSNRQEFSNTRTVLASIPVSQKRLGLQCCIFAAQSPRLLFRKSMSMTSLTCNNKTKCDTLITRKIKIKLLMRLNYAPKNCGRRCRNKVSCILNLGIERHWLAPCSSRLTNASEIHWVTRRTDTSARLHAATKRQTLTFVVYFEANWLLICDTAMIRWIVVIMAKIFLSNINDNDWDRIPSPLNTNSVC
jgi:hypothetical protein